MRVVCYPSDRGGCGYYRLIWPAESLARQGEDVSCEIGPRGGPMAHWDRDWSDQKYPPLDARVVGCEPIDADVAVFQRPFRRQWAEVIPYLQAHGTAVVVDIDDDFTPGVIPKENRVWRDIDGRDPHHNWWWGREALHRADLVTVSTPTLGRRFPGSVVVRNRVPDHYLDWHPKPHDPPRVGWVGQVQTHTGDLEVTGGAVADVLAQTGAQFHQVGHPQGVKELLGLPDFPTSSGYAPFAKLARAMTRFDIGIVPLQRSQFNAAKSWLKGLEYASVGLPFIATPTPEYQALAREGAGILARTGADWRRELLKLVRSPDLRAELGGRNRAVAERHLYDDHAGEWWEAWTLARVNYRKAAA